MVCRFCLLASLDLEISGMKCSNVRNFVSMLQINVSYKPMTFSHNQRICLLYLLRISHPDFYIHDLKTLEVSDIFSNNYYKIHKSPIEMVNKVII